MGKISRYTAKELRQLPLTLAKLLGSVMTVIGLAAVAFPGAGRPGKGIGDNAPYLLLAASGLAVFILSSRALAKRAPGNGDDSLTAKDGVRLSALSWALFLLFAVLFLCVILYLTR